MGELIGGQTMKNALVYAVNGEPTYLDMVVNSINSFYKHNKTLSADVQVYIVCDVPTKQL